MYHDEKIILQSLENQEAGGSLIRKSKDCTGHAKPNLTKN